MRMGFAAAVERWGDGALVTVDRIRRASILELFSLIVHGTPVDTGRLRGNFQVTLNAPATAAIARTDKAGTAVMAEAMANMGGLFDVVYLTNNLPYAEKIEYEGHSAQAPSGMVRVNAAKWPQIVEKNTREYS